MHDFAGRRNRSDLHLVRDARRSHGRHGPRVTRLRCDRPKLGPRLARDRSKRVQQRAISRCYSELHVSVDSACRRTEDEAGFARGVRTGQKVSNHPPGPTVSA